MDKPHLIHEVTAFLVDRQSRHLSPRTIEYYDSELRFFLAYVQGEVDTNIIRAYLVDLAERRNPGGVHAAYRALKVFTRWLSLETDTPNLMQRISPPKVPGNPLPGVSLAHVEKLLDTCNKSLVGQRDRAILLTLLDSGLRRNELLQMNISDVDLKTGAVIVLHGKGDKTRLVYLGARSRKEIIRYLRLRSDSSPLLWTTRAGAPLSPAGLRDILHRRSIQAGIPEPSIHDFRRAYALNMLRNGCDIYSLMRLMGHNSPATLQRYIALAQDDLQAAHQRSSPVDHL